MCDGFGLSLWLENPYQIKHSLGVHRGKNDKVDALRIADYAIRFQDKKRLYSLPDKSIASLKILLSERDMYISHKSTYQGQLSAQQDFMSASDYAKRLRKLLADLATNISAIDKKIDAFIDGDETLSKQHQQLCSIDGIDEEKRR